MADLVANHACAWSRWRRHGASSPLERIMANALVDAAQRLTPGDRCRRGSREFHLSMWWLLVGRVSTSETHLIW